MKRILTKLPRATEKTLFPRRQRIRKIHIVRELVVIIYRVARNWKYGKRTMTKGHEKGCKVRDTVTKQPERERENLDLNLLSTKRGHL